jgi:ABC-type nitrate/sulfonate/bicarbonate transport system permease component
MVRLRRMVEQFVPVILVGIIWEAAARIMNDFLFPPISAVLASYGELIVSGDLWKAFRVSMLAFGTGFGLAIALGIVLGLVVGRYEIVSDVVEPYINILYSLPRVALVPLILIWFGVGFSGRVFLIFLGAVIPIIVNTATGVRNVDKTLMDVGTAFCAPERNMFWDIMFPGSLPFVIAGIRIGFGRALTGVVIAEFFLEITGLGGLIVRSGDYFNYDKMIAVVLVLSLIGIILTGLLRQIEIKFTWGQKGRE